MRIPLAGQISTKDGATNKNSRLYNVLAEDKKDGKVVAGVRPGLNRLSDTSGNGNGIICFNGSLVNLFGTTIYRATASGFTISTEDASAIGATNTSYIVAYGAGVYVAAPYGPISNPLKFYKSTDGITWSLVDITYTYSDTAWTNNLWNGSQFLIISDLHDHDDDEETPTVNYFAKSSDGSSWTFGQTTGLDDFDPTRLAWNGSVYCLCSTATLVATSSNGESWTASASPAIFASIASNGSVFCALPSASSASCYTSSTGASWTARTMPATATWFDILYAGGKFYASATNGATAYSSDGITWASGASLGAGSWYLAHDGSRLVAIKSASGSTSISISSDDGVTWSAATLANSGFWWRPIANGSEIVFTAFAGTASNKITIEAGGYSLTSMGTVTNSQFDFALIP